MSEPVYFIGADIGGSHCTAALVDVQQKMILPASYTRHAIDASAGAEAIIGSWAHCIATAKQQAAVKAVCIAMPGPFDYAQGISFMQGQNKYEQLYGLNVKELLATALSIPAKAVMMDNDAACFLQGEVFAGAATAFEQQTVIGLTLGTGLGTAIYRNGKASNADLWRIPFNNGIAEDFLSSSWCVSQYRSVTGRQLNGVHELAARLPGDADAKAVLEMFGQQLANFLLLFIAREQPAAVCIGGNIAKAFSLFGNIVVDTIGHAHPQIPVFTSALGEEAMVLGAVASAVLPLQQTFPGTLSL